MKIQINSIERYYIPSYRYWLRIKTWILISILCRNNKYRYNRLVNLIKISLTNHFFAKLNWKLTIRTNFTNFGWTYIHNFRYNYLLLLSLITIIINFFKSIEITICYLLLFFLFLLIFLYLQILFIICQLIRLCCSYLLLLTLLFYLYRISLCILLWRLRCILWCIRLTLILCNVQLWSGAISCYIL